MDDHLVGVLSNIGVISFVALSAYLLLLTGEISFGQQAFFAIGAYAAGIATALWGWPLAAALVWGAAIGGGAAVLPTTSAKWKALTGRDILEGYGLSETSPILTLNPTTTEGFSATVGLPFPSTDIKLLDADDKEAAIGEPGEVCAKGPQVMPGYWQKPQANADAFTADGYFRTGDIGVFDARGFLKIVDRKKDMIIVSGFNVYPNEVEAIAAACAGVAECACVGRPDGKTGEAVRLFVAKAAGAALTEDDVIAHCRRQLAAYKVPKEVRFLDALPKSNVGKILRRDLRGLP